MVRHLRAFLIETMLSSGLSLQDEAEFVGDDFKFAKNKDKGGEPPVSQS